MLESCLFSSWVTTITNAPSPEPRAQFITTSPTLRVPNWHFFKGYPNLVILSYLSCLCFGSKQTQVKPSDVSRLAFSSYSQVTLCELFQYARHVGKISTFRENRVPPALPLSSPLLDSIFHVRSDAIQSVAVRSRFRDQFLNLVLRNQASLKRNQ